MEEKTKIKTYNINQICLNNLVEAFKGLEEVETKGNSTLLLADARRLLYASIQEIMKGESEG